MVIILEQTDANQRVGGILSAGWKEYRKLELDTDHCFYLLDGQVINDGTAPVLKQRIIRQQGSDGHFCCNANIAQRRGSMRRCPFRNVQKPLGAGPIFK